MILISLIKIFSAKLVQQRRNQTQRQAAAIIRSKTETEAETMVRQIEKIQNQVLTVRTCRCRRSPVRPYLCRQWPNWAKNQRPKKKALKSNWSKTATRLKNRPVKAGTPAFQCQNYRLRRSHKMKKKIQRRKKSICTKGFQLILIQSFYCEQFLQRAWSWRKIFLKD